jgi:hypothetical protein
MNVEQPRQTRELPIFMTIPLRDEGFYWVRLNGARNIIPAEYRSYTNDFVEEAYYGEHDEEVYRQVFDYGWVLDFGIKEESELCVYVDSEFSWIGPMISKPEARA